MSENRNSNRFIVGLLAFFGIVISVALVALVALVSALLWVSFTPVQKQNARKWVTARREEFRTFRTTFGSVFTSLFDFGVRGGILGSLLGLLINRKAKRDETTETTESTESVETGSSPFAGVSAILSTLIGLLVRRTEQTNEKAGDGNRFGFTDYSAFDFDGASRAALNAMLPYFIQFALDKVNEILKAAGIRSIDAEIVVTYDNRKPRAAGIHVSREEVPFSMGFGSPFDAAGFPENFDWEDFLRRVSDGEFGDTNQQ